MLRKLLKYEFRSTGRTFGLIYLATALLALATGLLFRMETELSIMRLIQAVVGSSFGVMICVIFGATAVLSLSRYSRGIYGDEGYLVHTLPVSPWQLITAKLIPCLVWSIASCAMALVALVLMIFGNRVGLPGFWEGVVQFFRAVGHLFGQIEWTAKCWQAIGELALAGLLMLAFLAGLVLQCYLCIGLGNLMRRRALWAVLFWFGINVVSSWLQTFLGDAAGITTGLIALLNRSRLTAGSMALAALFELLWAALWWAGTQYLLTRRLNLS